MPAREASVVTKEAGKPGNGGPHGPAAVTAPARIMLGSKVRVFDLERRELVEFALVGPGDLDPDQGRISPASPIGRALVGRTSGERITVHAPRGRLLFEVVDVR